MNDRTPTSNFTLNQLRYFTRTVELGSMSATAEAMFVAQSAVSMSISQLEKSLGCRLLVRHRARGVTTTEQGRSFYLAANRILTEIDAALIALDPDHLQGTLLAGCFTTLAPFFLPALHETITSSHPNLSLQISEVPSETIAELLSQRALEAVLTYGFDYGRDVEFTPVTTAEVYVAVSEHHPLARRNSVTVAELVDEPLILLDLGKSTAYFLDLFSGLGLTPQVHQRFGSFEVVRSMVARGHGYTILNQHPAHNLTYDGLRIARIPLETPSPPLRIGVAHRAGEPLSKRGQAFIDACRTLPMDR